MTEQIEIGGKPRPVRFGWAGLLEYEQQTGRKALADFADFGKVDGVSVVVMVDLVYYGLISGHRKAAINVDFDKSDVADWIGESPDVLQRCLAAFERAFPPAGNAMPGKPAKATPAA